MPISMCSKYMVRTWCISTLAVDKPYILTFRLSMAFFLTKLKATMSSTKFRAMSSSMPRQRKKNNKCRYPNIKRKYAGIFIS